jgi:DNA-binding transcriptional ArsR family regulator
VLKAAGLVSERRDGTRRLYLARQDEMRKIRDYLDTYWTSGLDRLRDVAEAAQRAKEAKDKGEH